MSGFALYAYSKSVKEKADGPCAWCQSKIAEYVPMLWGAFFSQDASRFFLSLKTCRVDLMI
jgi:hypothetical protein